MSMHVEAPAENFALGLREIDITDIGPAHQGKVRDWLIVPGQSEDVVIFVTSDRVSSYDKVIGTVPHKGAVLNLLSHDWFQKTSDIIQNHELDVPHPNVLVARSIEKRLPVEVVVRAYMAESATDTSIYENYVNKKRRKIYGITFEDGLKANQEFPQGAILTPTTKAETGHDEELTDRQARAIVDEALGKGKWDQAKEAALEIFKRGRELSLNQGLILVDTKYEFGVDAQGKLILIDEVHTPDSSRYWKADTYAQLFAQGKSPEKFDKEILRKWLKEHGFKGLDGQKIPVVPPEIIEQLSAAYQVPYEMLTGRSLPVVDTGAASLRSEVNKVVSESITIYQFPGDKQT
jgi:phosphoribosylaminoimidazole-succinocarboxamide synthase